jgi:hypothetical protein
MSKRLAANCLCLIVFAGTTAIAQQTFLPARQGVKSMERFRPSNGTGLTKVIGTVVDIRQTPVKNARLQLRNLAKGIVEQEASSNDTGEYEFNVQDPSTYVVEMVLVDGYVVALSNAGSLGLFETLNTVVRLPGRWDAPSGRVVTSQNVSTYIGMSAQTTMTAATLELAVEQNIAPQGGLEPVSP